MSTISTAKCVLGCNVDAEWQHDHNGNLANALAHLIQNQAQFVAHLDEDRQRFNRIERDLELIKAMLHRHEEILQKLPGAIRDKIDLKQ
jgi:hypothetical protein